jgi:hypothetical protein
MQWTDLVGHLSISAVFTHKVFKSELIGLRGRLTEIRTDGSEEPVTVQKLQFSESSQETVAVDTELEDKSLVYVL